MAWQDLAPPARSGMVVPPPGMFGIPKSRPSQPHQFDGMQDAMPAFGGAEQAGSLNCGMCGADCPATTKFCGGCGTQLPPAIEQADISVSASGSNVGATSSSRSTNLESLLEGAQSSSFDDIANAFMANTGLAGLDLAPAPAPAPAPFTPAPAPFTSNVLWAEVEPADAAEDAAPDAAPLLWPELAQDSNLAKILAGTPLEPPATPAASSADATIHRLAESASVVVAEPDPMAQAFLAAAGTNSLESMTDDDLLKYLELASAEAGEDLAEEFEAPPSARFEDKHIRDPSPVKGKGKRPRVIEPRSRDLNNQERAMVGLSFIPPAPAKATKSASSSSAPSGGKRTPADRQRIKEEMRAAVALQKAEEVERAKNPTGLELLKRMAAAEQQIAESEEQKDEDLISIAVKPKPASARSGYAAASMMHRTTENAKQAQKNAALLLAGGPPAKDDKKDGKVAPETNLSPEEALLYLGNIPKETSEGLLLSECAKHGDLSSVIYLTGEENTEDNIEGAWALVQFTTQQSANSAVSRLTKRSTLFGSTLPLDVRKGDLDDLVRVKQRRESARYRAAKEAEEMGPPTDLFEGAHDELRAHQTGAGARSGSLFESVHGNQVDNDVDQEATRDRGTNFGNQPAKPKRRTFRERGKDDDDDDRRHEERGRQKLSVREVLGQKQNSSRESGNIERQYLIEKERARQRQPQSSREPQKARKTGFSKNVLGESVPSIEPQSKNNKAKSGRRGNRKARSRSPRGVLDEYSYYSEDDDGAAKAKAETEALALRKARGQGGFADTPKMNTTYAGKTDEPGGGTQVGVRGCWAEYSLPDKRAYWINVVTQEKVWTRPMGYDNATRTGASIFRENQQTSSQMVMHHTNLFVGGLPFGSNDFSFRELFRPFGRVISCKYIPSGHYGFVKFATNEDAKNAIRAMDRAQLGGVPLQVRFANMDPDNDFVQRLNDEEKGPHGYLPHL